MSDEPSSTARPDLQVYRMVLHMVGELHNRGYQRLRISPGMSPTGLFWRCSIFAVGSTRNPYGTPPNPANPEPARYTSADGSRYFGWPDAAHDTPAQLADRFIQTFPNLCRAGHGPDSAYADWYTQMLRISEPDLLPIAYDDTDLPDDRLIFTGARTGVSMPLPPPLPPHPPAP